MKHMTKPLLRIAVVPGAENGVGPELLLEALLPYKNASHLSFSWCGDVASLLIASKYTGIAVKLKEDSLEAAIENGPRVKFTENLASTSALERAALFLKHAVMLAKNNEVDALVTGPIDKASLQFLDGGHYRGQTEFLAAHLAKGSHKPLMVFMGGPFLLSLLTVHLPLKEVSRHISFDDLISHISSISAYASMIRQKPQEKIKMVILGLNPHAGEDGLLGQEEEDIFTPAILHFTKRGYDISGPLPADGFFAYYHRMPKDEQPDVVIAAYHDQGLIPYKLLTEGQAVNVTLGLNVPRVSPAHGTAYAIAHNNIACPKSTAMAIETAIKLAGRYSSN
jgi:4-phospho-D-threonate 3-dehydrogenase / 4-phospho-D-erythronate 3-dehydrogenase